MNPDARSLFAVSQLSCVGPARHVLLEDSAMRACRIARRRTVLYRGLWIVTGAHILLLSLEIFSREDLAVFAEVSSMII